MMCLHRVANILKPHIGFLYLRVPGYWYQFADAPKSGALKVSLKKKRKIDMADKCFMGVVRFSIV